MTRRTSRALLAVAALLAAGSGAAVIATVATASSPGASAFVPITPCRLFDTRPGDINVGSRPSPLTAGETYTVPTWGSNGNCTIPVGATGLSLNIVAISPTASSFLTVFPADVTRPSASSLNWVAGQAPTPNAVTARLGADGQLSFYNLAGPVDLAVDIVGYYETVGSGATGPAGPTGPTGPAGPTGPQGPGVDPARVIWVAESGGDFTTISAALASITDNDASHRYLIRVAPGRYTDNLGFDMKDYVDIQGSGPTTVLASTGSVVEFSGPLHSRLSDLAIESTGSYPVFIQQTTGTADITVSDVSISLDGAGTSSAWAVWMSGGHAVFDDLRIHVVGGSSTARGFMIEGNSVATMRHLSIDVVDGLANCHGVDANGSSTVDLLDVDISVSGCGGTAFGFTRYSGSSSLEDVTVAVTGGSSDWVEGVRIDTSQVRIDGLVVHATGDPSIGSGVYAVDSTVVVRGSDVTHPHFSFFRNDGAMHVFDTVISGPTIFMSASCTGTLTPSLTPYTCA